MNEENLDNYKNNWNIYDDDYKFKLFNKLGINNYIKLLKLLNDYSIIHIRWDLFKKYWIEIQNLLYIKHRICPECGIILYSKCFCQHLKRYHNIDRITYMLMFNKLSEVPKCSNPECNNKVGRNVRDPFRFAHTCSPYCKSKALVYEGKHHFLHNNLVIDTNGKSILHRNSALSQISNNTHNFLSVNIPRDEFGRSVIQSKIQYRLHAEGRGNMQYWNYDLIDKYEYSKEIIDDHNKRLQQKLLIASNRLISIMHHNDKIWISPIERILGVLLTKLNYNIIPQYEIKLKYSKFIDYYIPLLNLGIECEGMYKYHDGKLDQCYIDRANEIFNITGIRILHIPSLKIYRLYQINIDKLDQEIKEFCNLTNCNLSDKVQRLEHKLVDSSESK